MRNLLCPKGLLFFVALCSVFGFSNIGIPVRAEVAAAPEAVYVWTAPEYGTPVDHYIAQLLVNDVDILTIGPLLSELARVEVVYGNKYRLRVAAVDAAGTQGPFSVWSAPFTPELAPPEF